MPQTTSFDAVLGKLQALLGEAHVQPLDVHAMPRYGALLGPALPAVALPRARARPASVEELQAVVRLAGETSHGLWTSPNHCGNGARMGASDKPALLLDLSRMNRILEFDTASACALIEPGVSFKQLHAHIAAHELPFWLDSDKNALHSISGSVCDRAFGYTPYGDRLLMQCGFEVVLANGTIMRTGMGALPGNNTWQLFKYNFGPYLDGLFSRSDLGIVSKLGLWLMPAPPAWQPFMITLPDDAALAAAVDLLRPFKIDMSLPGSVVISHIDTEAALVQAGRPRANPDFIAMLQARTIGTWNVYGALYGLPANVELMWQALAPALAALPGAAVFTASDQRQDPVWELRTRLMRGLPAFEDDGGGGRHTLWFAAAAAIEGADARAMHELVDAGLRAHGISGLTEYLLGWRTLFLRVEISYALDDYATARAAALAVIHDLAAAGYGVSHDSADLTAAVAAQQTHAGLRQLHHHLGRALDPAGIFGARFHAGSD